MSSSKYFQEGMDTSLGNQNSMESSTHTIPMHSSKKKEVYFEIKNLEDVEEFGKLVQSKVQVSSFKLVMSMSFGGRNSERSHQMKHLLDKFLYNNRENMEKFELHDKCQVALHCQINIPKMTHLNTLILHLETYLTFGMYHHQDKEGQKGEKQWKFGHYFLFPPGFKFVDVFPSLRAMRLDVFRDPASEYQNEDPIDDIFRFAGPAKNAKKLVLQCINPRSCQRELIENVPRLLTSGKIFESFSDIEELSFVGDDFHMEINFINVWEFCKKLKVIKLKTVIQSDSSCLAFVKAITGFSEEIVERCWNNPNFKIGRIGKYRSFPSILDLKDLTKVTINFHNDKVCIDLKRKAIALIRKLAFDLVPNVQLITKFD